MQKSEVSGFAVLLIGIALLVITFIDAYLFLKEDISIIPIPNLIAAFGEVLAPMIAACIRMIYLIVMGWIGSTVTIRGVTLLLQVKSEAEPKIPKRTKPEVKPEDLQKAWENALQEAKLEVKSGEKAKGSSLSF